MTSGEEAAIAVTLAVVFLDLELRLQANRVVGIFLVVDVLKG